VARTSRRGAVVALAVIVVLVALVAGSAHEGALALRD